jgi:hypothetical protein
MRIVLGALAALLAALCLQAAALAQSKPSVHGKALVSTRELPADVVARFVRFAAKPKAAGGGLLADTEDWRGETFSAPAAGNPYTLVVRVTGTAVADGEVMSAWMGGWNLDGTSRMALVNGAPQKAKAGQAVVLTGATSPVSFKEDRTVGPELSLMRAENLKIDGVQVEVWSGVGKPNLVQLVFSWSPLLLGRVFLGVFLWFRRG